MPHTVCYLCYCQSLTYATPSYLPVLFLQFLEKLKGHFYQFYAKPKLLGHPGQHPRFVVAELLADRICKATKFVPAKWGMIGHLKALCGLH